MTQERAERTLRRLQAGRTAAARCRPGERLPSCAHPRGLPGHGKPSTASRSAAHSPASKRPFDLQRSAARLERRRSGRSLALTQERAKRTLRRLQAGRTAAASRRPGERLPSCAHPRGLPGHGKPSTAPDPRHTARLVKDHLNNTPLRPGRGLGAPSLQRERLPTPALPGASVPALHAQCLLPTSTDWQDRNPPTAAP